MEDKEILLEKKDYTALITINHPPANAWNLAAMEEFKKALDQVETDRSVRAIVITGAGDKCFSAGFDVTDAANASATSSLGRALWRRLDRFAKPTIAAINGHALGGGLELAMCCHFRIMADAPDVKTGLTELNLGIIPGWGGTQRLPRIVGRARALDMILFSRRIGAREALEIGLVNSVCPRELVVERAMELAGELGVAVSLRTVERACAPLRRELRAEALATVRFETAPGQQMQIDFGRRRLEIGLTCWSATHPM